MKRDEVVYLIDCYLMKEFMEGHPRDANGAWDSWQSASNILAVIEQAGMLPPPRNADQKSSYGYARVYEWETPLRGEPKLAVTLDDVNPSFGSLGALPPEGFENELGMTAEEIIAHRSEKK